MARPYRSWTRIRVPESVGDELLACLRCAWVQEKGGPGGQLCAGGGLSNSTERIEPDFEAHIEFLSCSSALVPGTWWIR